MRRFTIAAWLVFTAGFWTASAQAGWWDFISEFRISTENRYVIDSPTQNPPPPPAPPATYTGNIVGFEISFKDQTGEAECRATIESEGRGFNARFNAIPRLRDDDPQAPIILLRQTAACLSAQRAYLRNEPVTITGTVDTGTQPASNGMKNLAVIIFSQATESSLTTSAPATATICNSISCQVSAMVENLSYQLNDEQYLCRATLKVRQPDQSELIATARVKMSPELCRDKDYCDARGLKLAYARFQACQLFEEALGTERNVFIVGYGQGSVIEDVVSVTLNNSPPPNLTPLF